MDEVFFHASERVEAFQVQLLSRFQQGREIINECAEHFQNWTSTSAAHQIQNTLNQTLILIQRCLNEIKDVVGKLDNPQQFFSRVLRMFGFNSASISVYYGSLGFLIGVGVGFLVGLSRRQKAPVLQKMCAVVCTKYGGLDALSTVDDIQCPQIHHADEVMVQVKAASVDQVDLRICSGYGHILRRHFGRYNANVASEFPIILGRDCAGIITEVGPKVNNFELGDEVWFSVPYWASGVLAEYVVVKQSLLSHKPKGITFEVAASLPYSGMLAWNAMVEEAGLTPKSSYGRRVLIHTCSNAVGCLLVQLAHLWGAHVTVTCPLRVTPVAQALGADCIVAYEEDCDIEKELRHSDIFDVVFNTVGRDAQDMCLKFCRDNSQVISTVSPHLPSDNYGMLTGSIYTLILKMKYWALGLVGVSVWTSTSASATILENLGAMVETGGLQPVVDKIFSPHDAELAFQHIQRDDSIGKSVIRFRLNPKCTCGAYSS